jgi:hypothetical protein
VPVKPTNLKRRRRTQAASLFDGFEGASDRVATVSISSYI